METNSSFQKPVTFSYFWLNYCDENHIQGRGIAFVCGTANEVRKDERSESNAAVFLFCNLTS